MLDLTYEAIGFFQKIIRWPVFFRLGFILLVCLEIFFIITFTSFSKPSLIFALLLGSLIITLFLYFVLSFYIQAKKPDQLEQFQANFIEKCPNLVEGVICLSEALNNCYETCYSFPPFFKFLNRFFQRCASKWHQQDVYDAREKLYFYAINTYLSYIKKAPLDPSLHAHLGSLLFSLSQIYETKDKIKYELTLQRAISEFKIVSHFLKDDLWIYAELARAYSALGKQEKAIKYLERLLRLCPDHVETLYDIGFLYFQKGLFAEGLTIYESLQKIDIHLADQLILQYDSSFKGLK